MSYINYSYVVNKRKLFSKRRLIDVINDLFIEKNPKINRYRLPEDKKLLDLLRSSLRFKDIYLKSFEHEKDITKVEACNILSKVGLCALNYVDREVNTSLSGGELKRIELATILARKPILSIFDEPEAGIDLWSFNNLIEVFKQIEEDSKGITLIISHQERILNIADKIILLENGEIKEVGDKSILKDIFSCPKGGDLCE